MVILKPRLQDRRWGDGDKTPVFDGAAGGFVNVYGGTHLEKHRSAILSLFELGAFGPG